MLLLQQSIQKLEKKTLFISQQSVKNKTLSDSFDKPHVVYVRFAEVARTVWFPFSNFAFKNLHTIRIFNF